MRYTLESPHGRWSEDGSRFIYDLRKVADSCGYTLDEVKTYGVLYCRTFRRTWPPERPVAAAPAGRRH
ncbi:MAG TPA: hypothetical protein VJO12_00265 [Stellaceae bacterium]|nr:hypothetical protein [Stellaceae bacterium]